MLNYLLDFSVHLLLAHSQSSVFSVKSLLCGLIAYGTTAGYLCDIACIVALDFCNGGHC